MPLSVPVLTYSREEAIRAKEIILWKLSAKLRRDNSNSDRLWCCMAFHAFCSGVDKRRPAKYAFYGHDIKAESESIYRNGEEESLKRVVRRRHATHNGPFRGSPPEVIRVWVQFYKRTTT